VKVKNESVVEEKNISDDKGNGLDYFSRSFFRLLQIINRVTDLPNMIQPIEQCSFVDLPSMEHLSNEFIM